MLTNWNRLLNTDCLVVNIKGVNIYPIFRNGSISLKSACDKVFTNNEISACDGIDILIRNPRDRFVSGINEYCRKNRIDVTEARQLAFEGRLVDRHFAPQYVWLLHLFRYYKGEVNIKPFSEIKNYCSKHRNYSEGNTDVPVVKRFVDVDYKLLNFVGKTVNLEKLITDCKDALS